MNKFFSHVGSKVVETFNAEDEKDTSSDSQDRSVEGSLVESKKRHSKCSTATHIGNNIRKKKKKIK